MSTFTRRVFLGLTATLPFAASSLKAAGHATTHEVSIEGFSFVPNMLEVKVGDTIVFTNKDGAPHTATADDGSFDTGRLKRNASAEVQITEAGEHSYFCAIHRSMTGVIVAS